MKREVQTVRTQILTCAIRKTNGVVVQIGKGYILHPVTNFKGDTVKRNVDISDSIERNKSCE